jgi:hypothetical protein
MTTRRPARVLFQSHHRKGMGHLVRGLNIAREITALDETADIHFYTKAAPPEAHWNPRFHCNVEPAATGLIYWPEVRAVSPDIVVFDTLLRRVPEAEPLQPSARFAFVMRKCVDVKQHEVFEHP